MPAGTKAAPGPLSVELAAILRERMGRLDVSKTQLADAVGMSRSQISGILNAKKHVDVEQLDSICWALNLDMLEVVSKADELSTSRHVDPDWRVKPLG